MNWEAQNEKQIAWARETTDREWYVLRCDPQEIPRLIGLLPQIGVVGFVPIEHRTRRSRGSRKAVTVAQPIMTGYVVAGFRGAPNWFVTFQLSSVYGVVARDGRPARVPQESLDRVFSIHQTATASLPGAKSLKTGDMVRVTSGGFLGHEAKLLDIHDAECEFVVDLFGKQNRVRLPISSVEAA